MRRGTYCRYLTIHSEAFVINEINPQDFQYFNVDLNPQHQVDILGGVGFGLSKKDQDSNCSI
jgi:hypothetical protein